MDYSLPNIHVPVVRYYIARLKINTPGNDELGRNIVMVLGQTFYTQLLIKRLSDESASTLPLQEWLQWQEEIPVDDFVLTHESTTVFNEFSGIEVISLKVKSVDDSGAVDVSPMLIDLFEVLYLFLSGAILPGIQLLDYLLDSDISSVFPVRELLQRSLPDELKINILAESQLMSDPDVKDGFIHMNLVWFLGKTDMAGIDSYLQNMIEDHDTDEDDALPFLKRGYGDKDTNQPSHGKSQLHPDANQPSLTESEQDIKLKFEDELKDFYRNQEYFYTRITGVSENLLEPSSEFQTGHVVFLATVISKSDNSLSLVVRMKNKNIIGYIKPELSELLLENVQNGYHYSALVTNILSDDYDSDNRVHLLIKRLNFQFN